MSWMVTCKLDAAACKLDVDGCKLDVTWIQLGCKLDVDACNLDASWMHLDVISCRLDVHAADESWM